MCLLEKLWDDTIAGPRPETGLCMLRKCSTFNFRTIFGKDVDVELNENQRMSMKRREMLESGAFHHLFKASNL
ncbi:hypothetical protein Nepgr_013184 [Nepenthes gracilis]|uniref:Uncharacterized protein n=1 Tax=Nepenthes gracilis TaxID=150966 RepID=A0AAD3SHE2_NEPGR|nr:hypothetical protein Nepgr_013184 [Nepenthes gracilis]